MNIVQPLAPPLSPELIAKFRKIVGDKYALTDAADIAPYVTEERDLFHGRSPLVLRPGSTPEVAAICRLASEHKIAPLSRSASRSVLRHGGAAQPVVDRLAEPVMRHRHDGDGARASGVEGAKIAEKVGGGLIQIAPRR